MEPHKPAIKWSPTFFLHSTSSSSLALVLDISCSSSSRISCRSSSRLAARASIASLRKNSLLWWNNISPEHDIHGSFLSTFLMNISFYIKLVLKSSMFFTILLTWRVFAFNIFIIIRCIYTIIIHVWRYLRCLFQ